jgi:hypothetical protein
MHKPQKVNLKFNERGPPREAHLGGKSVNDQAVEESQH